MIRLGLTLMVALVLVLRVAVRFKFGLGVTLTLEMGVWLRLWDVFEVMLVLKCGLAIEVGCKLELEVGTRGAGLNLASDSVIVAVVGVDVDMSVLWELLGSDLSGSKADFGLSFPKTSLTVLL